MPDAPELNLDSILGKEKKPELSQIDPEFYERAAKLLSELEAEKNKAAPESTNYTLLANLLETSKAKVRDILQVRMRKIVNKANSQSVKKEKSPEPLSLTQEEKELYNALLDLLSEWRGKRLDQVFGKRPDKKEVSQKEEKEPEKEEHVPKEKTKNFKDYIMVRLLTDVPTFVGMDNRNYTLAKEDVAMMPGVNAKALIARKAAVQIVMK